ncbi:hypothetical protein QUB56_27525 [Microcoleus sp. AR_TQ3_B6]|uniref:hypothetical protein n=1 Tax=Microcoleus sp. AR_TQ3_B6 TaxID=3055284 RepID=UPI002FD177FB
MFQIQLKQLEIDEYVDLAQLQNDVAALAQQQEKLAELQKEQVRQSLKSEITQGIQQLTSLAERINDLGNQLEAEMLQFKKIASETNKAYCAIQEPPNLKVRGREQPILHGWRPLSIWQVHQSIVPTVVKQRAVFVLTAKIVDLFQSDRERDVQRLAESAQRRRKALENWLAERRQF